MSQRAFSTSLSSAPTTTRRHVFLATIFSLILSLLPMSRLVAGAETASPKADNPNADVIAQGVATLPADQIAWRLVQDTAEPLGGAIFEERALGFAIATDDALLLTNEIDGSRIRLAPGEAAFTLGGITQMRESLGNAASPYFRIALVTADEASNPNGDTLIHAGEPFASPAGDRDIDLVSVRLDAGETATIPTNFPALVVVLDGEATAGNDELKAGDAATINGSIELEASKDGTHILVAIVGAEIPSSTSILVDNGGNGGSQAPTPQTTPASSGLGKILVLTKLCPDGVTPDQAADPSDAACFAGGPVDILPITITAQSDQSTWTVYPAGGTAVIPDLTPGTYSIAFGSPDGLGTTVGVCGGQDSSADLPVVPFTDGQVTLEVRADREYLCGTSTTQLYDGPAYDYTGELAATFWVCPDGMTLATVDASQCTSITDGFDFGFQSSVWGDVHLFNASLEGNGFFWEGLPVGDSELTGADFSQMVWAFPAGYTTWATSTDGGPLLAPHAGGYLLWTGAPSFGLTVYFFTA